VSLLSISFLVRVSHTKFSFISEGEQISKVILFLATSNQLKLLIRCNLVLCHLAKLLVYFFLKLKTKQEPRCERVGTAEVVSGTEARYCEIHKEGKFKQFVLKLLL